MPTAPMRSVSPPGSTSRIPRPRIFLFTRDSAFAVDSPRVRPRIPLGQFCRRPRIPSSPRRRLPLSCCRVCLFLVFLLARTQSFHSSSRFLSRRTYAPRQRHLPLAQILGRLRLDGYRFGRAIRGFPPQTARTLPSSSSPTPAGLRRRTTPRLACYSPSGGRQQSPLSSGHLSNIH